MTRKYICPECKQKTGVNIVYGYPSAELFEAANRDEVALGGCIIDNEQPDRCCISCKHEWKIKRRALDLLPL